MLQQREMGFSCRDGVVESVQNAIFLFHLIPQKILRASSRPTTLASRLWPSYLRVAGQLRNKFVAIASP